MTDKITDISAAAGADILSADKTGVPAADRSAAAIQTQPADGSDGLTTVKEQQLGGGMTVFTNDIHTFGTDAVLLASFAQPRKSTKAVELGTGCGIISLIWCRDGKCASIDAIDIQKEACDLVNTAAEKHNLARKLKVHNADLNALDGVLPAGGFDLVVMNPPYKSKNDGLRCERREIAVARHEIMCDTNSIVAAAARLLNTGGRLCMCQRPSRLCDLMVSMRNHGIEPKRLRMVEQRQGASPNLFLIEGKKGAKSGIIIEKPLVIEDKKGDFSEEIKQIYGKYYAMKEANARKGRV